MTMAFMQSCKQTKSFLLAEWGAKCWLSFAMCIVAILLFGLNACYFHYHGVSYFNTDLIFALPGAFLLYVFAVNVRSAAPRTALVLDTLWTLTAVSCIGGLLATAVQLTPFTFTEHYLHLIDHFLGFDVLRMMSWAHQRPLIFAVANCVYVSLSYQLLFGPFLLVLLQERRQIDVFFIAALIAMLSGFTFYYFFPSTDPASILHSPYFSKTELSVVERFIRLHQHLPIQGNTGGLIGFPSFHVIWAMLVTYAFKNRKILFMLLIIWNSLLIISPLMLGWHFLADLIAGAGFAVVSIWLAVKIRRRVDQRNGSRC